ncbi:hypothetical protein HK100_002095 [Physocladia obscura]|uniref:Uncharacterized protein n=1 Tax=Physocladia obscura TaxID=109957 RepID=A0AAD5T1U7_9FUNG|nr:hypothetical protein HK100_002095 [Physocladia obscura]
MSKETYDSGVSAFESVYSNSTTRQQFSASLHSAPTSTAGRNPFVPTSVSTMQSPTIKPAVFSNPFVNSYLVPPSETSAAILFSPQESVDQIPKTLRNIHSNIHSDQPPPYTSPFSGSVSVSMLSIQSSANPFHPSLLSSLPIQRTISQICVSDKNNDSDFTSAASAVAAANFGADSDGDDAALARVLQEEEDGAYAEELATRNSRRRHGEINKESRVVLQSKSTSSITRYSIPPPISLSHSVSSSTSAPKTTTKRLSMLSPNSADQNPISQSFFNNLFKSKGKK